MKPLEYDLKVMRTVKAISELKGIDQSALANCLNMDNYRFSLVEKGEVGITPGQLNMIANELNVSITLILAIANADEKMNFGSSDTSTLQPKILNLFIGEKEKFGVDEHDMRSVVGKIKTAYDNTDGKAKSG